ncbi:hypothetical protein ABK040_003450 [Willaertia magna]
MHPLSQKLQLFSVGVNNNCQLGHKNVDGYFHPMKILSDDLLSDLEKVECGRSHSLFKTKSGKIFALGRNCHGQCGVGNFETVEKPTRCLFMESNEQHHNTTNIRPLLNVHDIACGWFHSLILLNDLQTVLITGNSTFCKDQPVFQPLQIKKDNIKKYNLQQITHIKCGCHHPVIVYDNRFIYSLKLKTFDVDTIQLCKSTINEIQATEYGYVMVLKNGQFYVNNVHSILLQTKNNETTLVRDYSHQGVYQIRVSGVSSNLNFRLALENSQTKCFGKLLDQFTMQSNYEVYPCYYGFFFYDTKQRKLYAKGDSDDFILGLGRNTRNTADKKVLVPLINEYLENYPFMEILDIRPGCDFTILILREKESKEIDKMKSKMSNACWNSKLVDIQLITSVIDNHGTL